MKQKLLTSLLFAGFFFSIRGFAQENQNTNIKQSVSGITKETVDKILPVLEKQKKEDLIALLKGLLKDGGSGFKDVTTVKGLEGFCKEIYRSDNDNIFTEIENNENIAIVFLYRNITIVVQDIAATATTPATKVNNLKIDFESLNTIYLHKDKSTNKWSNYLLETKKVYVFMLDLEDKWYQAFEKNNFEKKFSNSGVDINYKTSFFKQSFKDLASVYSAVGAMGGGASAKSSEISFKLTMIEIDPKRVKAPCDIVVKNKSFKEDFKIAVHERNFVSFQVGLANNKFSANNFSIANNNLVVKPNATQKEEWKSNLTALIAFHPFGRDIDNFNPIWKSIFARNADIENKNKRAAKWFYNNLFSRIGIYGGVKISKDPLAGLTAGFNYALTKEFSVNVGWTWTNEVIPQVTEIGTITSLPDALKYAKRDYSGPKFSWGLTFAPSSVISMLGLKDKKEN
ncbi:hypothetical protein ESA94_05090 [Lacibacter luteus]|uniref:DUF3078 domain-containing protein n=1 Tax=Lacibacter luteus TaxID=2508719 RepID=A0A4Q1CMW5_9BACT|nr:hypothetical protein [Lacibacter luteus]RXK62386.1 hypothetical protein ESA94_05090 [Lacibacter luteus]